VLANGDLDFSCLGPCWTFLGPELSRSCAELLLKA
jgi:hypothetical protein